MMYPLLIALLLPVVLVWTHARISATHTFSWRNVGRVELTELFLVIGIVGHLVFPQSVVELMPEWLPGRLFIAYATGVLEIVLALLIWTRYGQLTGRCIIVYLLLVLPFNIYGWTLESNAINYLSQPYYLWLRVPLQGFYILCAYYGNRVDQSMDRSVQPAF